MTGAYFPTTTLFVYILLHQREKFCCQTRRFRTKLLVLVFFEMKLSFVPELNIVLSVSCSALLQLILRYVCFS